MEKTTIKEKNITISDLEELLFLIDWMAAWINNVGNSEFKNGERYVKEKTIEIRKKYELPLN